MPFYKSRDSRTSIRFEANDKIIETVQLFPCNILTSSKVTYFVCNTINPPVTVSNVLGFIINQKNLKKECNTVGKKEVAGDFALQLILGF